MPKMLKMEAVAKLQNAIDDLEKNPLDTENELFIQWRRDTRVTISYIFGEHSHHKTEFESIGFLPGAFFSGMDDSSYRDARLRGYTKSMALLKSMIREIEEYWEDATTSAENESVRTHLSYNRVALLWDMTTHFDSNDIENMCFELAVDHQSLRGEEKTSKIRELILYCERNEKTQDLVVLCRKYRPNVNW